mmetsp:Transcript_9675/g.20412  ORF Transcript_9675/g.20412 Transcript_9675/m.20412 type:complete len:312 (+) Transcript_9675:536-1471(+)
MSSDRSKVAASENVKALIATSKSFAVSFPSTSTRWQSLHVSSMLSSFASKYGSLSAAFKPTPASNFADDSITFLLIIVSRTCGRNPPNASIEPSIEGSLNSSAGSPSCPPVLFGVRSVRKFAPEKMVAWKSYVVESFDSTVKPTVATSSALYFATAKKSINPPNDSENFPTDTPAPVIGIGCPIRHVFSPPLLAISHCPLISNPSVRVNFTPPRAVTMPRKMTQSISRYSTSISSCAVADTVNPTSLFSPPSVISGLIPPVIFLFLSSFCEPVPNVRTDCCALCKAPIRIAAAGICAVPSVSLPDSTRSSK